MKNCLNIILLLLLSISIGLSQEICDNGIDDDNDGWIDLNDDDCDCPPSQPTSLIPNPSFENLLCCPDSEADLNCAEAWIQASEATSDLYNTCGIEAHPFLNYIAPRPIPDGEGWVGFRDGKSSNRQFKEYVGACLNATMEVGSEYRLDFFLGFPTNAIGFDHIDMTIFATTDCNNLPFGQGNSSFGCPTNGQGWVEIGTQRVTGVGSWVNVVFDFVADQPYSAIVLGPGCAIHPNYDNAPYFFVDRLNLAKSVDFEVPFAEIFGHPCSGELTIVAEYDSTYTYQWYKEGIAIDGATEVFIDLFAETENFGEYQVLITDNDGCFLSTEYDLFIPEFESQHNESICEGQIFNENGTAYTTTGSYTIPYLTRDGCDSIVTLDLEVIAPKYTILQETICEGEVYSVGGQEFSIESTYLVPLIAESGCDSIVDLNLKVSVNSQSGSSQVICQGESYTIGGVPFSTTGLHSAIVPSRNGCDSTILLDLLVKPNKEELITTTICEGENIIIDGNQIDQPGGYTFMLLASNGCDSVLSLDLTIQSNQETQIEGSICDGEFYPIDGQELSTGGNFTFPLKSQFGCDSMVNLSLEVNLPTSSQEASTICIGEQFEIVGDTLTDEGDYELLTTNNKGCDSTIFFNLTVIDWQNGIQLPSDIEIELGDEVKINPIYIDPSFIVNTWRNGEEIIGQDIDLPSFVPLSDMTITLNGVDQYGCPDEDQVQIRVSRNIIINFPNVFSPNGDGSNETFKLYTSQGIARLDEIIVYDRWGNLVYKEENVTPVQAMIGWNGSYKGIQAEQGVYVFVAKLSALDGLNETVSGDVTLIR